jgi:S-adenosylmethionine:tRNA ribosyltransferase-isomerase
MDHALAFASSKPFIRCVANGQRVKSSIRNIHSGVLRTADLEFHLPDDLIATDPATRREDARLLVVRRSDPSDMRDMRVSDLPSLLRRNDRLVVNATRVLPARLEGFRTDTNGRVEGLYLDSIKHDCASVPAWHCMLKGKSLRAGLQVTLTKADGTPSAYKLRLIARDQQAQAWIVIPTGPDGTSLTAESVLPEIGRTPLPPYIMKARKDRGMPAEHQADAGRYQTTFASAPDPAAPVAGAVAAPTAGLHLTPELMNRLREQGVDTSTVLLQVGAGTFKPVETEFVEWHRMHTEWCKVPGSTFADLNRTTSAGGRVICVGTTSARTLETFGNQGAYSTDEWFKSGLLITPGFEWSWTQGLLTNFHLPRSTLLAMVSAMFDEGLPALLRVYAHAIKERYRFFSYGDAMIILPD